MCRPGCSSATGPAVSTTTSSVASRQAARTARSVARSAVTSAHRRAVAAIESATHDHNRSRFPTAPASVASSSSDEAATRRSPPAPARYRARVDLPDPVVPATTTTPATSDPADTEAVCVHLVMGPHPQKALRLLWAGGGTLGGRHEPAELAGRTARQQVYGVGVEGAEVRHPVYKRLAARPVAGRIIGPAGAAQD